MNREAQAALGSADAAMLVVTGPRWTSGDDTALHRLKPMGMPIVLVVNKIDLARPRRNCCHFSSAARRKHDFAAIVPCLRRMLRIFEGWFGS